jgi:hypothetical protein
MRQAFIPALQENASEIEAAADAAVEGLLTGWGAGG